MAQRSLNKAQLIGNLTQDPELRYTPQGTAVCSFGLATNRSWTMDTGEKREEVEFHRLVAWAKLAELCAQLLFKGRRVFVEGRLQTRRWNAQDGTPRQTTEIVIDEMLILDSRRSPTEGGESGVVKESVIGSGARPAAGVKPPAKPVAEKEGAEEEKKEAAGKKEEEGKKEEIVDEIKVEDIPF